MNSRLRKSKRSHAVLAVDGDLVEWLDVERHDVERLDATDSTNPRYGCSRILGPRTIDLVDAAERARAAAGCSESSTVCVLTLGDRLAREQLLQLPDLGRSDRLAVLRRRAGRLWESEGSDPVFSARRVDARGTADESRAESSATWLLSAAHAKTCESLLGELKTRGFRIGRVCAQRSAALDGAHRIAATRFIASGREKDEFAWISVCIDQAAISAALVAGDRWISGYRLPGDFLESPSLGQSLLQDLRNCAGFWRKVSRGERIRGVLLIGLDRTRGESLSQSIAAVMDGVEVYASTSHADHPQAGAVERLLVCLDDGPFGVELGVSAPPGRRRISATLAVVGGAVLALSAVVQRSTDARATELADSNRQLLQQVAGHEAAAHLDGEARDRLQSVLNELKPAVEAAQSGLPLGRLTARIVGAFEGRATLLSAAIRRRDGGDFHLTISGTIGSDPIPLVQSLKRIAEIIERDELLERVVIRPMSSIPERPGGSTAPESAPEAAPEIPFTLESSFAGTSR